MKSIRQKRIEDDNNKEWAQIRYKHDTKAVTNYISFSNEDTQFYGWNPDYLNYPTFYSYFNRDDVIPEYLYDKASENEREQLGNFDYFYFFYACKTMAINILRRAYLGSSTHLIIAHLMAIQMFVALIETSKIYLSEPYRLYDLISKYNTEPLVYDIIKTKYIENVKKLKDVNESIMLAAAHAFTYGILNKDYLYEYEYAIGALRKTWNEFVDDSKRYLNIINSTGYYDADGNWHYTYKACWVKYTIELEDKVTTMISQMKLYKQHQLKRGRYISNSRLYKSYDSTTLKVKTDYEFIKEE